MSLPLAGFWIGSGWRRGWHSGGLVRGVSRP